MPLDYESSRLLRSKDLGEGASAPRPAAEPAVLVRQLTAASARAVRRVLRSVFYEDPIHQQIAERPPVVR